MGLSFGLVCGSRKERELSCSVKILHHLMDKRLGGKGIFSFVWLGLVKIK